MSRYDTLGVHQDATQDEIKRAYKSLAQKLHPDRQGGDEEAFKRLQEAYAVLSDEDSRAHYDRTGESKRADSASEIDIALAQLFRDGIKRADHQGDLIAQCLMAAVARQLDIKEKIQTIKVDIAEIEKLRHRIIQQDKGEENVFNITLGAEVHHLTQELKATQADENLWKAVILKAQQYKDRREEFERKQRQGRFTTTSTGRDFFRRNT